MLGVVVPFFNEEENVGAFFRRLTAVASDHQFKLDIVAVDDGSTDGTLDQLLQAKTWVPNLRILQFSRNFGKEAAMSAGLDHVRGERVVVIDADLQHPPEVIPELLDKLSEGHDVVYAHRRSRQGDGAIRSLFSRSFYRLLEVFGEVALPADAGDFRVMNRDVVEALKSLPEKQRFMKGLYAWVGFDQVGIPFDVAERHAGKTKFSFFKLFGYGWNALISFSAAPLRISSMLGLAVAFAAGVYGLFTIAEAIVFQRTPPGYATIASAILFLGGVQLVAIGVLGEYVSRIVGEAKGRPAYIIGRVYD
ncbi:MAG: glycosyltransferase family 2 protein [Pseudomonadota bacterium]